MLNILKMIGFGVKIRFQVFPIWTFIGAAVAIVHGLLGGFSIFVTQIFFDTVGDVAAGEAVISQAYLMAVSLGSVFIIREVLNGFSNFMGNYEWFKVKGVLAKTVHSKMARIDQICLEDTQLHDDINKASEGSAAAYGVSDIIISFLTFYLPFYIFMGFYLHHLHPQFILALVLVFVPIVLSQVIRTGIISKFEDEAAPVRREYNYYNKIIVDRKYFKETRMLGAYKFFLGYLFDSMRKLSLSELKAMRKTNLLELGMGLLSAGAYLGILFMLVSALLAGNITVGAFAAIFGSIATLFFMLYELVNIHISRLMEDMGKAHNFIKFMELPEREGIEAIPDYTQGIIAENISFTYPHADEKSIDNISLSIKAGETIAIVGENGAGKSTLVRLLIGLYKPSEGRVNINGLDTAKVSDKSVFDKVSGVFQNFQKYQMTLEENIKISNINREEVDLEKTMQLAGVDINSPSFPEKGASMLSREFDGVDLSGGEWQRVAIARGLYRSHNTIVLDEPTAAIDPIEESRIYRRFVEISKGKTAIIVTHRLGSTKIADRVVVMDKGRIVDVGTHFELMQKGGLYREMFEAQASWYMVG